MKPFTTLNVVRYDSVKRSYTVLRYAIEYFLRLVIEKSENENLKHKLGNFPGWMTVSYDPDKKKIHKDFFDIKIKITEGPWSEEECKFLVDLYTSCFVKTKSLPWLCGGFDGYKLVNANELFYTFCKILKQKFPTDEHMMCIIQDLMSSYTIE